MITSSIILLQQEGLGSSQGEQSDFWLDTEASRNADCSQSAIHVEMCLRRAAVHGERVSPGNKIGHKARRRNGVIDDFYFDLSAMRVTSEAEFNPEFGRARKAVRIVREQDIRYIAPYQRLNIHQHGQALALIINSDQIELLALPAQRGIFVTQQAHAVSLEEILRVVLGICVDLVVAIAAPGSEGRL